jgi:hypothetical protein
MTEALRIRRLAGGRHPDPAGVAQRATAQTGFHLTT